MLKLLMTCNGCTECCENFAMLKDVIEDVNTKTPGMLTVLRPLTLNCDTVHCNMAVRGVGCKIHPAIIGKETRPSFCTVPECTKSR